MCNSDKESYRLHVSSVMTAWSCQINDENFKVMRVMRVPLSCFLSPLRNSGGKKKKKKERKK